MAAWLTGEHDTDLAQALRTNTEALTRHGEEALYRPDAHKVLYRLGRSLGESGQVTAAIAHFDHLTTTACSRLGEDHRATRTARSNLASWRGQAADPAGLAQLFDGGWDTGLAERVAGTAAQSFHGGVEQAVRLLGEDHPTTLTARSYLALWRGRAGDATGAAHGFDGLLEHVVLVLGEDHPHTLTVRGNVASWRGETGDAAGAAQAYADLQERMLRGLGKHHLAFKDVAPRWKKAEGTQDDG
ncbi:hypothetical protein [Streptomyces lutosisoli]|uniref:Tetratricopeptide repeat protein n=1 Tax=Streptomyces lutosisoli TaxID=2665721 RepID=A0ABW2W2A2_9ACTN